MSNVILGVSVLVSLWSLRAAARAKAAATVSRGITRTAVHEVEYLKERVALLERVVLLEDTREAADRTA